MLMGKGGNIGLSVGSDGVLLIDSQFQQLTEKIMSAINKITNKPAKFVINTHWHQDHTGRVTCPDSSINILSKLLGSSI